jgi:hypothetical protein
MEKRMIILVLVLIVIGWLLCFASYYSIKRVMWASNNIIRLNNLIYCHNIIKLIFEKEEDIVKAKTFLPDPDTCAKSLEVNNFEDFIKDKMTLNKLNSIDKKLGNNIKKFITTTEALILNREIDKLYSYVKTFFPEDI